MNFSDAIREFERSPACIDGFRNLRFKMNELIISDSSNAAAYLIISKFSRKHYLYFEDQEMSQDLSNKAKTQMLEYLLKLEPLISDKKSEGIFEALSNISYDYSTEGRILEP